MKLFKIILDVVTIVIITAILIVFCQQEDKVKISGTSQVIEVKEWDTTYSKSKVLDTIEDFARKNNVSIYKATTKTIHNQTVRDVYNFNTNAHQQALSTFDKKIKTTYISRQAVEGQDIKGQYFVAGDKQMATQLISTLNTVHVKSDVYHLNVAMIFIGSILDNGLFIPLAAVILVYILYSIQLRSAHFKEYALKQLNGYSSFNLISESLRNAVKYWLLLFIGAYLLTLIGLIITENNGALMLFSKRVVIAYLAIYGIDLACVLLSFCLLALIDIPQMIKGKKPFATLRFISNIVKFTMIVSATILLINAAKSIQHINAMNNVSYIWNKMNQYYFLEIAPVALNKEEADALDQKLYQFTMKQEKQGALLIKNNSIYHPAEDDYSSVDNGNFMIVNDNFVDFYQNIDQKVQLEKSNGNLQVLLPEYKQHHVSNIKHEVEKWSKFQTSLGASQNQVEMKPMKHKQQIYSFDLRNEAKFKYIKNPAIININGEQVSPNFYSAAISQGFYLFKDLSQIQKDLKTFGLDHYVSGVTNYTDQVQTDIRDIQFKLTITILTIIISFIVVGLAMMFEIQQYFEQHQKYLMLRKLNGFNRIQNYRQYIILSNLSLIIVMLILYSLMQSDVVLYFGIFMMIAQLCIHHVSIRKLEKRDLNIIKEL
ncbi:DUF1430 domain-containing protein [Staphylococcus simulans]